MDCREFLLRYTEYDDSLIPAGEADRFRRHMAACASCARYDRVLRKGRMVARQIPGPAPSSDFTVRLQRRLLRGPDRTSGSPSSAAARLAAGLAAATVVLVVASALQLIDPAPTSPGPAVAAKAGPDGAAAGLVALTARLPTAPGPARAWSRETVAPAGSASYSPLVMGPPVYRIAAASPEGTTTIQRTTLD